MESCCTVINRELTRFITKAFGRQLSVECLRGGGVLWASLSKVIDVSLCSHATRLKYCMYACIVYGRQCFNWKIVNE